jgi:two-component sensor histidine kinase
MRQATEDRIITEITTAFNQSFTIDTNLDITLEKVRQFLNCDRVLIYELHADGTGTIVKEAASHPEVSILDVTVEDICFATTDIGQKYLEGKVTVLDNVQKLDDTCYKNLLRQFQVKANLVLPIIHAQQLWGLLIIHQCDRPRTWESSEIRFVKKIAEQISSAAQKEKLYLRLTSELNQKETLLKEIHHRVKNNLQIMSSLLRLQFRRTSAEVRAIAEEYQNRIQSMALIHDQLYRSEDLSHIDFHSYLQNLAANLFYCYSANPELIKLNIEVNDISLPLDHSIPLGLVINELLSNALKYAFPEGQGAIDIKLKPSGKDLSLVVADDGIGLSPGFDYENTDSLGMQLVLSLTDQLGGKLTYVGEQGVAFHISFPMPELD